LNIARTIIQRAFLDDPINVDSVVRNIFQRTASTYGTIYARVYDLRDSFRNCEHFVLSKYEVNFIVDYLATVLTVCFLVFFVFCSTHIVINILICGWCYILLAPSVQVYRY